MKRWKKAAVICITICLLLSLCPTAFAAEAHADMPAYADALRWAKEAGVMTEEEGAAFDPDGPVTRAKALTLLWKASGSPTPVLKESPFADLAEDWYLDAVTWAAEQGITYGRSSTVFAPDDYITRSQMAAFLYRAQGEKRGKAPGGGTLIGGPSTMS